jgi:alcohol dehydrogenase (NADP+)
MSNTKAYAAYNATSPLKSYSFDRRAVGPHDVKIDILFSGVCHSDLHQARNDWKSSTYPMVPGHEIVGRVTEVGRDVKKFKVGDLAGVGVFVDSCRTCANCQQDLEQYCLKMISLTYNGVEQDGKTVTQGGYSTQIVTDEKYTLHISDKLSLPGVAPLLCAGITTYSPLRHWKVGPGKKVGVVGLGGLGHMALKFAASFGADVTLFSTSESKRKDAEKLGAAHFCNTKDPENFKTLANKLDFIIDTVAAEHDCAPYLSTLKLDGVLCNVGLPGAPLSVPVFSLLGQRRSLASSGVGGIKETQEMLDYCAEKGITADVEMITIDKINEAYDRMEKNDVKYRFVIDVASLR